MYLYTHVHCLLLKASITGNKPKNILIWLYCKLQNIPHLEGPYQWGLFTQQKLCPHCGSISELAHSRQWLCMISRSRKPNPDTSWQRSSQLSSKMLTWFCVYSVPLQRQPAFDTFDSSNSLFAGYFCSLSEDQTLQEVPTGFDSTSYGKSSFCSLVHLVEKKFLGSN